MKPTFLCLSMLTIASFVGCSNSTDEGEYIERASPAVTQTVASQSLSSIAFTVRATWGSSCGSFSRSEITKTGSIYSIKILGKEPKETTCLAVMTSFEAPVIIRIPSTGTYTFKFWQSDNTSKDTTMVIRST